MLAAVSRSAARGPLQRSIVKQRRPASSLATRSEPSTSKAPSSAHTYLDDERKRKLVSLYHQTEKFVTLENLSSYIDKRFANYGMFDVLDVYEDSSNAVLQAAAEQRELPKTTVVTADGQDGPDFLWNFTHETRNMAGNLREERREKLKAAVYGVDDSKKASLEMVEKHMEEKARGSQ